MTSHQAHSPIPLIIPGARSDLVAYYHRPAEGIPPAGGVLQVPAFAEEMNRCRAMVSWQARAMAAEGYGVLLLDPYGTGDSPGDFQDADLETWLSDLRIGIEWLRAHAHGCRTIWGVRLGAILAARLAQQDPGIDRLLFWQPVVTGKTYWTQFLRIRLAAEISLPDGIKSTETLRQLSQQGQAVEASGYLVGSRLAQALDQIQLPQDASLQGRDLHWFEVVANSASVIPPVHQARADRLAESGVKVQLERVAGPAFWQVHERDVAPSLIDASMAVVRRWKDGSTLPVPAESLPPPATMGVECPVVFPCEGQWLVGMVHRAVPGTSGLRRGVVIVVAGGPQYRVGAHRQFVSLARLLAANGYPVMRFDLRGMGDSSGQYLGYEKSVPDIRAAIDALQSAEPSVTEVVCFGECESASGILFYAHRDRRVVGAALANPWVRTQEGQAEVILKHYYRDRLLSREFWGNVLSGRFKLGPSLASFFTVVMTFVKGRKALRAGSTASDDLDGLPLPARTAEGLRRFGGRVLILMSGRDYIAREFDEVTKSSEAWRGLLDQPRVRRVDIADADHTFSKPEAKAQAQQTLLSWLRES